MPAVTGTGTDVDVRSAITGAGLPSSIEAVVHEGHVTLSGRVPWLFHRVAAEVAVRGVGGVTAVTNRIVVEPLLSHCDVRRRIADALCQTPGEDARHVNFSIARSGVTLTGHLASPGLREAVANAVAAAPGVTRIDNRIEVRPAA
jgi:osmotically-inducible protein OsmY